MMASPSGGSVGAAGRVVATRLTTTVGRWQHSDALGATFARFGVVGCAVTVINYVLFLALLNAGLPYINALVIAWCLSISISFGLNRRVTFRSGGRISRQEIASFAAASLFQLGLALAGFVVLIDVCAVPPALAYPINLLVLTIINFAILRGLVYPLRRALRLGAEQSGIKT